MPTATRTTEELYAGHYDPTKFSWVLPKSDDNLATLLQANSIQTTMHDLGLEDPPGGSFDGNRAAEGLEELFMDYSEKAPFPGQPRQQMKCVEVPEERIGGSKLYHENLFCWGGYSYVPLDPATMTEADLLKPKTNSRTYVDGYRLRIKDGAKDAKEPPPDLEWSHMPSLPQSITIYILKSHLLPWNTLNTNPIYCDS